MKVSVIIPVQDEDKTIGGVLEEVKKLNPYEIIIVLNGSKDQTGNIAKRYGCTILSFPDALGNDVGRAIGAKKASGDILLFLDGDIIIKHNELIPFINAIKNGYDVALNDLSRLAYQKAIPHYTTVSKLAVNAFLRQTNLSANSILSVPHAIKRDAIEKIGWSNLADPILAQAMAITLGLRICSPVFVDVIYTNRIRSVHIQLDSKGCYPKTTNRIIGDHLCALHYLTKRFGSRGGFPDRNRNVPVLTKSIALKKPKYSAIITISGDNPSLLSLISQVKMSGVDEVILVAHMVKNEMKEKVRLTGAIVIEFHGTYFPSAARLVGAKLASADICIFIDGVEGISADELPLFLRAIENGADIVLNNRKKLLDSYDANDLISTGQYFVNMAVSRPDLYNNSLSFVPFALRKNVIDAVGNESFLIPPLAQVKAILAGCKVEILLKNKVFSSNQNDQKYFSNELIMGDQLEAISYLFEQTDERGGFSDGGRRREFLK